MPDNYFSFSLLLSMVFNHVFPIQRFIFFPNNLIGVVLVLFGLILAFWSNSLLIKKQTSIEPYGTPSSLVILGPFKISRNPIYLGMVLILLGVDILLGSLSTFIFTIIFIVIINRLFIAKEEKKLEKIFGNEYLDYKKRVRRWI